MIKAVLFSTPTCPWFPRTRRYLVDKRVKVSEINVARDQKAATEMVRRSGQMGVPVTKIGESWIVGFNRWAID
jgi:glutaredoxin 3